MGPLRRLPLAALLCGAAALPACGPGSSTETDDAGADDAALDAPDVPEPEDASDGDAETEADAEAGSWDEPFTWTSADAHECPPTIGANDRYGELLAALGLDRSVGIPRSRYESFGGRIAADDARLAVFHDLADDPDRLPCWTSNLAARADDAVASDHPLASVVAQGAAELGRALEVGGRLPDVDPVEPLVAAIRAVYDAAGQPFETEADVRAQAAEVPEPVQRAAARILLGVVEARAERNAAFGAMGDATRLARYYTLGSAAWLLSSSFGYVDPDNPPDASLFVGSDEGSGRLFGGAVRLAQAIDETDLAAARTDDAFSFVAATPWGAVVLGGGTDDTYEPEAPLDEVLLLLDTGGNDTYRVNAGGSGSIANPISVAIDLDGSDRYGYPEVPSPDDDPGLLPSDRAGRYGGDENYGHFSFSSEPRQGAGVTGYGFLLDLGGDPDVYRTLRRGQGFASFGVGVLWDDGGDDDYECEAGCQGAAFVGIAVQYDGGGDDTYRAFFAAQAFAWIQSFGLQYDLGGNDTREAVVDSPVVYHSPQAPGTANGSSSQGFATGWRRDDTGTHISGGLALLRDVAGDDDYEGAVFVQGVGYWYGIGALADGDGADHYDGLFYTQGAAAHFAIGSFLDRGSSGDFHNTRRPPLHSAMGLGHDFSVSVMVDEGGDDTYVGPSRSIGASKCHGFGLFVDNGGNDSYTALDDKAIGWATDYDWAPGSCGTSTTLPSYGFFVDVGGMDTYTKPDASAYGDGRLWISDDLDDPDARELAGGIDAPDGESYLHAE